MLIRINYTHIFLYAFYALSIALMIYLIYLIYKRLKVVHYTLSVILTNVDNSKNIKKCIKILNNLLLALLLFFSAMLSPLAMFVLNLSLWVNIMPLVIVMISFYYFKNLMILIDDGNISHVPSYTANPSLAKL